MMALLFISSIVIVFFFSFLPAIYAIAVHLFLVAFRERPTTSLFGGAEWSWRHWSPILLRLGYAAVVNIIVILLIGGFVVDGGGDDNRTSCSYYWADAMSVLGRIRILVRQQQQQQQCITAAAESTTTNICREPTNNDKSITPQQQQQQQQQLIIANATMVILMLTIITTTIIAVSIMLLLQTRKIEVDGPIPPTTPTSNTDDTTTTTNYYDVRGKTIFVTGANTGIGFETARQLYALGANIVLGCRSKGRAVEAMRRIIGTDNYYTEDDDDNEEDDDNDDDDDKRQKTNTKIITAKRREGAEGGGVQNNNDRRDTSVVGVVGGGGGGGGGRLYFVPLDLTSRASIHKAVLAFQKLNMPLHILINNAGVMRNRREVTEDGLEMTMAANHLGHFLLTNLLLPTLRATAMTEGRSSRVITISSSLHHNATRPCSSASSSISTQNATGWRDRFPWRKIRSEPGIDLGDLNCEHKRYALFEQYAQTKLANVMFALELNRRESKFRLVRTTEQNEQVAKSRLGGGSHDNDNSDGDYVDDDPGRINDMVSPSDGGMRPISIGSDVNGKFSLTDESLESYPQVVSYCVHPGLVRTDFVRDMPWYLYYPHKIDYLVTGMLQKSPRSGAYTTVYCATLDTRMHCNNRNDSYFVNSELQPVARCALNEDDAAKLWKLSSNLVS